MPRRVDHDAKREEIVDAALRLIARSGLETASIRNIAEEAGLTVRPVQYYFADKATLLSAAHARVTERLGARVTRNVRRLGPDPAPRAITEAVIRSFLPTDAESWNGMVAYYAFYAAELTDPALRIKGAVAAPNALSTVITNQLLRHRTDMVPADAKVEAQMLVLALPSVASGVIAGYSTMREARRLLNATVDRLFPA